MCFASMPKPKPLPPPPSKAASQSAALAEMQQRRQGAIRSATDVTKGAVANVPTYTPAAGNKFILGG